MNAQPEKTPLLALNSPPTPEEQEQERSRRRSQRRKRVIGHIVAILAIYFVITRVLYDLSLFQQPHRRHHPHWNDGQWASFNQLDTSEYPIPPDLTVAECADWNEGRVTSLDGHVNVQHVFRLPISSSLLFLTARGPLSVGNVNIVQSDSEDESAIVTVVTHYDGDSDDFDSLRLVKLCRVVADEDENGVGIFSARPHHRRHDYHIRFNVTVTLPKGSEHSPLVVSNLSTKMDGVFSHYVEDLADSVFFNSINLAGALRPIQVRSLKAGTASIGTANSPIEGNFTVTKSLKLKTANAHIDASVKMLNKRSGDHKTNLVMETVNSPIEASVSLLSVGPEDIELTSNGAFSIKARNARGSVKLAFPTAPVNSTVIVDAKTALSPINVNMHKTFEGSFAIRSTPLDKKDVTKQEAADPEGKGRKRSLVFDSVNGGSVDGRVFWGDEQGKGRGSIKLETAMSPIVLVV
ncbi:hypothetical protein D9757_002353 [Collybiopsis confluens]|uniref:DUF7330 domain-containing protein n=1 Tax=Collybiopsis confluens TaxID=2823264 RepID=A0A8H5HYD9_9AGAR|nr:hypothetical protein D9757_002353 [Collybiopsis confluens]